MFCRSGPWILVFAALSAYVAPASADLIGGRTLLFEDSYDATSTCGINQQLDVRQSGTLVAQSGTVDYHAVGTYASFLDADGVNSGYASHAGTVIMPSVSAAALNQDFNGDMAQGGMVVQFMLNPTPVGGLNYASFSMCMNDALAGGYSDLISAGNPLPRVTIGVYGDQNTGNLFGLWSPDITDGFSGWYASPASWYDGNLHQVTVVCTDDTDQNPFDGSGKTNLAFYVDGTYVTAFEKGGGGYSSNYIAMSNCPWASVFAEYDNVQVYGVPEPSTLVLLALGLLGAAVYARRRR